MIKAIFTTRNEVVFTMKIEAIFTSIRAFARCKPSQARPSRSGPTLETNIHKTYVTCALNCRPGRMKQDWTKLSGLIGRCFVFTTDSAADFWHQKYVTCKFFQLAAVFSITESQTKNWSRIFFEDNFMANKLYSATFFSKLILFIDNAGNVIEKHDKLKFSIRHRSMTSDGTKLFCRKFLCLFGKFWPVENQAVKSSTLIQHWYTSCMSAS